MKHRHAGRLTYVCSSPLAVITPAKSHPEVIVAAVAARDRERARQYAKKHSIPIVHNTYQGELLHNWLDLNGAWRV